MSERYALLDEIARERGRGFKSSTFDFDRLERALSLPRAAPDEGKGGAK